MLPEALVFAACVHSVGCSEVAAAYAVYYPDVAHTLRTRGRQVERYLPAGALPVGALLLRGEAIFTLERRYSMQFSNSQVFILYDKSF